MNKRLSVRTITILLALMMCMALSGCKKSKYDKYSGDTLIIRSDKDINTVLFYELADYGNINSFDYNDDNRMMVYNFSVDFIALKRVESVVKGDKIRLVTNYFSDTTYTSYIGKKLFIGDVADVVDDDTEGYEEEKIVRFKNVSDNSTVSKETVRNSSLKAIYIEGPIRVELKGKIRYVSENVTVEDSSHAMVSEGGNYIIYE